MNNDERRVVGNVGMIERYTFEQSGDVITKFSIKTQRLVNNNDVGAWVNCQARGRLGDSIWHSHELIVESGDDKGLVGKDAIAIGYTSVRRTNETPPRTFETLNADYFGLGARFNTVLSGPVAPKHEAMVGNISGAVDEKVAEQADEIAVLKRLLEEKEAVTEAKVTPKKKAPAKS